MALSESTIRPSRSLNNFYRDMQPTDPHEPTFLDLASISPVDGHFVASPLNLDLYNPMATSNKQKSQIGESKFTAPSIGDKEKNSTRVYPQYQHQKKSSTASLADFLKNTGPDDLRQQSVGETARPVSPQGKKKNPGSFLLKFAVGKSTPLTKKDDVNEISTTAKAPDIPAPFAEPQFTASGRKYYAIKVDYPFPDDASISGHPLLADSPIDPGADTRSEIDYKAIMAMKKHHRISSVLASDTSMEFLVERTDNTPRSSGLYTSYPPSHRNTHSLVRSSSLSEIISPSESIRDDSSVLPGDSISVRPAQVNRTRMGTAPGVTQSTSVSLLHSARHGLDVGGARSAESSYVTPPIPYSSVDSAPSPIPPFSQASNGGVDLIESLDMLDKIRQQKASETESVASYSTTRSLQQRRRAKKLAQYSGSFDETRRARHRGSIKPSRSTNDLNSKGLPPIPPHMNDNTDEARKARAAAVAAALSPRVKQSSQDNNKHAPTRAFTTSAPHGISLENYAIPEDDVLSVRSGISAARSLRRERVRAKRQKDFDEERSRKLDEAMRLLQKDVQMKRQALDREGVNESGSAGSQTPRPMASIERLRTPPRTPPSFQMHQFSLSPVEVLVDFAPSGLRRKLSKTHLQSHQSPDVDPEARPKTSNSQHTDFTNRPITPISSAPSSPTKSQHNHIAKQSVPRRVSLPPSYPPPNPSPPRASHTNSSRRPKRPDEEDREMHIAALEEQKWVLEQALRVLLNQQSGRNTPSPSPMLHGYLGRTSPKPTTSSDRN